MSEDPTGLAGIDPSLRTVARLLPYRKGLFARHLPVMRAGTALARRVLACRDCEVVAVSSTASVRIHRPPGVGKMAPAVLWIHGGGYVAGSAALEDRVVRRMAEKVDVCGFAASGFGWAGRSPCRGTSEATVQTTP
jgi:acetyl esterase/lipase